MTEITPWLSDNDALRIALDGLRRGDRAWALVCGKLVACANGGYER